MPPYPGFGGGSYQQRSLTVDCERTVNLYAERAELGHAASAGQDFVLCGMPGKVLAGSVGGNQGAALVSADTSGFPDNQTIIWYAVVGAKLYAITFHFVGNNPTIASTLIGNVDSRPMAGTPGLFPAQILVLGLQWVFVVANGKAWVAAFGPPITASQLAAAAPISFSTLNAGGAGYNIGDTGTVNGGVVSAQYVVLTVDGMGGVLTYRLTNPGTGYTTGAGVATTPGGSQPGTGAGFKINITSTSGGVGYAVGDTGRINGGKAQALFTVTAVDVNGSILTYALNPTGAGYAVGTTIGTTNQGGAQPSPNGSGFFVDITAVGAPTWGITQQTIGGILTTDVFITYATWMDGYVIVGLAPNTADLRRSQFFLSGLNDPTTWDPLEFATKEGNPDPIVAVYAAYENLLLFGTQTTEIWYDSGNVNFQFQRIGGGGLIQAGCVSPFTIQKMDGTVIWLGQDERGTNVVWELRGLLPVRISTHPIETRWKDFQSSFAMATVAQHGGHYFYSLHFPIEDQTWVYDSISRRWSEATSEDGMQMPHSDYGRYKAFGNNIGHGALDYRNGNFYLEDLGYWDEAGTPILRERVLPPLVANLDWTFYSHVRLHTEQGNPPASDTPLNFVTLPTETPTYTLEYSGNGGQSFNPPKTLTGSATDTGAIVEDWRVGRYRQLAIRMRSRSRVNHVWANFYIEVQQGRGY